MKPRSNFRLSRHQLRGCTQAPTESVDAFVRRLRTIAADCEYTNVNEQLIDALIFGTKSKEVQKPLLKKSKTLTLDAAIEIAHTEEAIGIPTCLYTSCHVVTGTEKPKRETWESRNALHRGMNRLPQSVSIVAVCIAANRNRALPVILFATDAGRWDTGNIHVDHLVQDRRHHNRTPRCTVYTRGMMVKRWTASIYTSTLSRSTPHSLDMTHHTQKLWYSYRYVRQVIVPCLPASLIQVLRAM